VLVLFLSFGGSNASSEDELASTISSTNTTHDLESTTYEYGNNLEIIFNNADISKKKQKAPSSETILFGTIIRESHSKPIVVDQSRKQRLTGSGTW
jgi:glutamate-1-semialdehyde aminotransferase